MATAIRPSKGSSAPFLKMLNRARLEAQKLDPESIPVAVLTGEVPEWEIAFLMIAKDSLQNTDELWESETSSAFAENDPMQDFLNNIYELASGDRPRRANRLLFSRLDYWIENSQFEDIDEVFMKIDASRLPPEVMLAPLAVTLAVKDRLSSAIRDAYLNRIKPRLEELRGQSVAQSLLARFG